MTRTTLAAVISSLWLTGCLVPKDVHPGVALTSKFATQYNHRGMVMDDRGVWQPEANIDIPIRYSVGESQQDGTFTVNTWANMGLTNSTGGGWLPDNQGGKFSEVDLTAKYSQPLGPVDLSAGVLAYVFPNGSQFPNGVRGSTTELFASLGGTVLRDTPFWFYPRFVVHYDADEVEGAYLNLAVSRSIGLDGLGLENLSLFLEIGSGWSDENQSAWTYGLSQAGFADVRGIAEIAYEVPEWHTKFTLGIAGSVMVDDKIREWFELIDISPDNVWGTLGIGVAF